MLTDKIYLLQNRFAQLLFVDYLDRDLFIQLIIFRNPLVIVIDGDDISNSGEDVDDDDNSDSDYGGCDSDQLLFTFLPRTQWVPSLTRPARFAVSWGQ